MRILHFDCFSGAAGDMIVGALRDVGVAEDVFFSALDSLGLPSPPRAAFERGSRQGISGWAFRVECHESAGGGRAAHPPAHTHQHGHHHPGGGGDHAHGRRYREIRAMLEKSNLAEAVRGRALAVFRRVAEAEGRIHGLEPDEVHFHEVGAVDSIADIVCACAGIAALAPERVTSGPLVEGSGFVECAHGRFPLPAPATLEILRGLPLAQTGEPGERITPTGAAILAEFCGSFGFGPMPAMRPVATGFGLGARDVPGRPNVLRVVLGEGMEGAGGGHAVLLETNLDDLTPELAAAAAAALFEAGALDVWTTPAHMKKNRPGFVLSALAPPHLTEILAEVMLRETTSFGLRITPVERRVLDRETSEVSTSFGPVRVKIGRFGGCKLHASPEFEDCAGAARRAGVSSRAVYLEALAAAQRLPG